MCMKNNLFILALVFAAILLVGCGDADASKGSQGILADRDTVASIQKELDDKENSLLAAEGDVFWTKSGTLWHSSYKCSSLSRSKTILHGTLEEAMLAGKVRACTRCSSSGSEDDIWEQLEKSAVAEGDLFFTRDSSLCHTREDCDLLSGSQTYHGSRAIAILLGKSEVCGECEK